MRLFEASFDTVLKRFFLMMAVIVLAFVIQQPLLAYLGFPIFIGAILGVKLGAVRKRTAQTHQLQSNKTGEVLSAA